MSSFSEVSLNRLRTCHPALQRLFLHVVKKADCSVICGFRNKEDQDKAFADGFSRVQWPNGKHNKLPSEAVDVMPYPVDWNNVERMEEFSKVVKATAQELGIKVSWGGDWTGFVDRPHWEIPKETA